MQLPEERVCACAWGRTDKVHDYGQGHLAIGAIVLDALPNYRATMSHVFPFFLSVRKRGKYVREKSAQSSLPF